MHDIRTHTGPPAGSPYDVAFAATLFSCPASCGDMLFPCCCSTGTSIWLLRRLRRAAAVEKTVWLFTNHGQATVKSDLLRLLSAAEYERVEEIIKHFVVSDSRTGLHGTRGGDAARHASAPPSGW